MVTVCSLPDNIIHCSVPLSMSVCSVLPIFDILILYKLTLCLVDVNRVPLTNGCYVVCYLSRQTWKPGAAQFLCCFPSRRTLFEQGANERRAKPSFTTTSCAAFSSTWFCPLPCPECNIPSTRHAREERATSARKLAYSVVSNFLWVNNNSSISRVILHRTAGDKNHFPPWIPITYRSGIISRHTRHIFRTCCNRWRSGTINLPHISLYLFHSI